MDVTKKWRPAQEAGETIIFPSASIKKGLNSVLSGVSTSHGGSWSEFRAGRFMDSKTRNKHISRSSYIKGCSSLLRSGASVYTSPGAKIISLFCLLLSFRTTAYNDKIQQLPNRGCLYYRKPHGSVHGMRKKHESSSRQQSVIFNWCMMLQLLGQRTSCCAFCAVNRATHSSGNSFGE